VAVTTDSVSATNSWKYETCPECGTLVQIRGNSDEFVKVSLPVSENSDDLRGELDHLAFFHRRCTPMDDVEIEDFDE